jgi:hypothetical protein
MDSLHNKLLAINSKVEKFSEYWQRTIGDMTRCSMLQFTAKQNCIRTPACMQHGFTNRIPSSWLTPGQTWLSPRQQQYPDRTAMDLTELQPFVITWWTHVNYARCPGKKISKEGWGKTVDYVVHKRPIMALIIFSQNGRINLHDD